MYYFLPKAANRPVFSYRLSIIHFWALIFIYIWAGPHHLLYTALPDWAQSLGHGVLGDADRALLGRHVERPAHAARRVGQGAQDPMLKFMVVAVTVYGMATLEGPTLAIKSVNSLVALHRLDHRPRPHRRAGLDGMISISLLYWLFPRLC